MTESHPVLDVLVEALNTNRTVLFDYDDKPRIVEVHAVGTSTKDGSHVVRGYQVAGEASRPLPAWTLFSIDKIEGVTIGMLPSEAPRPGYKQGDKQMATIIAQLEVLDVAA